MRDESATPTAQLSENVIDLVAPIVADLKLDLYDLEFNGGILKSPSTPRPDSDGGVTLDQLALVTRLVRRDLDHHDPIPGHYTLEVTSPGLERTLRTATHFQREDRQDGADPFARRSSMASGVCKAY